jgi:hypothetical protein
MHARTITPQTCCALFKAQQAHAWRHVRHAELKRHIAAERRAARGHVVHGR